MHIRQLLSKKSTNANRECDLQTSEKKKWTLVFENLLQSVVEVRVSLKM